MGEGSKCELHFENLETDLQETSFYQNYYFVGKLF